MSDCGGRRYELLRNTLHERFHQHTRDLATSTEPDQIGAGPEVLHGPGATARQDLHDVTQALRRIADGTYGTCERCRIRIPLGRLRLMPHARFCVSCHQRQPQRSHAGRRPHARSVPQQTSPKNGSMPGLTVIRHHGPGRVVRLAPLGEIDLANAEGLRDAIIDALSEPQASGLVVDLHNVDFLSCAGVSALVAGRRAAVSGARSYAVVNAHGVALKVLLVTGLLGRLAHRAPYRATPSTAEQAAPGHRQAPVIGT